MRHVLETASVRPSPFGRKHRLARVFVLGLGLLAGQHVRPAASQQRQISPQVQRAVRGLLSADPAVREKAMHALRQMGAAAQQQLQLWVSAVRQQADRVEAAITELQGKDAAGAPEQVGAARGLFSQKLVQCRSLVRDAKYKEARALANAVLLLDPRGPYAWELRRIARRAQEGLVSTEILEPSVDADKLVYEVGQTPRIVFRVTNHDRHAARILLEKGVLGEIRLTVTQRFLGGGGKIEKQVRRIEVSRDVEQVIVGPGLVWDRSISFETPEKNYPPRDMVARVQVAGRFRPTRWTVERERDENISLPMNATEFWIVPKGQGDLCERPLEKLTAALVFGNLESLFVSGQIAVWVGEEDAYFNELLVETLIGSLEDMQGEQLKMVCGFLRQATGYEFGGNLTRWKRWWRKKAAHPEAAKAPPSPAPPPTK